MTSYAKPLASLALSLKLMAFGVIPYLEAFTWNPRRVHLGSPGAPDVCWRCGKSGSAVVGPIVYLKNDHTQKRADKQLFKWQDPAAFYAADEPFKTMKSGMDRKTKEPTAASGRDLDWLLRTENAAMSLVVRANPSHRNWLLVLPCTNPANNKTFDHRLLDLASLSTDAVRAILPGDRARSQSEGLDGWTEPSQRTTSKGAARFVRAAAQLLTHGDWAVLSGAAYREMHQSPAAFDLLCGLFWPLRGKVSGLPSRSVAWLVLKLMAAVPASARLPHANAAFCPLRCLAKRQPKERRKDRTTESLYPVSLPRGNRLEVALRHELDKNTRQREPQAIDWPRVCYALDQLLA